MKEVPDVMLSTRRLLQVLCAGVLLLVLENAALIAQLWQANRALRSMRTDLSTIQDDVLHVKEDTEANGEAIEYLTSLVDGDADAPSRN